MTVVNLRHSFTAISYYKHPRFRLGWIPPLYKKVWIWYIKGVFVWIYDSENWVSPWADFYYWNGFYPTICLHKNNYWPSPQPEIFYSFYHIVGDIISGYLHFYQKGECPNNSKKDNLDPLDLLLVFFSLIIDECKQCKRRCTWNI